MTTSEPGTQALISSSKTRDVLPGALASHVGRARRRQDDQRTCRFGPARMTFDQILFANFTKAGLNHKIKIFPVQRPIFYGSVGGTFASEDAMTIETTGAANAMSSVHTSYQVGERDVTRDARARSSDSHPQSDRPAVPNTAIFGEASSNLARSLAQAAPSDEGRRTLSSGGVPDAPSIASRASSGDSPPPPGAEVPAVAIPAELRAAITELVSGNEASDDGRDVALPSRPSFVEVTGSEEGDELDAAETGTASRPDTVGAGDQVISLSSPAASALAAGVAMVPFGAVALGGAANMADFLAPAVVDGIQDPLSRGAAAAAFSGIFLGLTASVTTALGEDLAQMITENRIKEKEPEGDPSRGAQLWSAVKNQTIPAYVGFAAAFATANALDAESGKLGDTNINTETVLLKLARATAGAVGYGLAKEAAKSFSGHSLTRTEVDRVFDNTRKLGEAIKENVTSLPQAISAYTRPTEKGKATEFGNVLGAALGFAAFAAINGAVTAALQSTFGEDTSELMSEPSIKSAIATAAGVAGFVIADQLTRNIYANIIPVREETGGNEGYHDDRNRS